MENGASWASLNGCISATKFFSNTFANIELCIIKDLELYLKKFAIKVNKQKRPLSKIEIMKVMDFYSNKDLNVKMCRDICIVLFCWYALLRYDDVSQLKVEDFKIDNDVFDILFCFCNSYSN